MSDGPDSRGALNAATTRTDRHSCPASCSPASRPREVDCKEGRRRHTRTYATQRKATNTALRAQQRCYRLATIATRGRRHHRPVRASQDPRKPYAGVPAIVRVSTTANPNGKWQLFIEE